MGKKRYLFRKSSNGSNPYRVFFLLILVLGGLFVLRGYGEGSVKPLFNPTPTPTRIPQSHSFEGETHFLVGDLNAAIASYRRALALDPQNAQLWAELARIQVYSSNLLTTDQQRKQRLSEALDSANEATRLAPEDSTAHAVRAFVLDWYANPTLAGEKSAAYLTEAEQEAVRALTLDNQNTLALVYYAEILNDQQKWTQAGQVIQQALQRDSTLMDVHRVNAILLENQGQYTAAIKEYEQAAAIAPNLTFLYINIGVNYRHLASRATDNPTQTKLYEKSLEYFVKAANLNEQLKVKDPIPYLAISKTYSQMGEFFIAARNVMHALQFDPTSPDVYGQLGIIYFKSRNYEGSIPALKCATKGCSAKESCEVRECDEKSDPAIEIPGMPLSNSTLVYYYTYGSVLAGMHRPNNSYCQESLKVMDEIRRAYSNDPSTMAIIQASEQICASFGVTR